MARKLKLFYSYADADEALCKQLEMHLSPLRRPGLIEDWHPRNISVGTEWQQQINAHLEDADIILLLISPDFINSKYGDSREVDRAIARHESGEASLVPILLRPTFLQVMPFARLQALPRNGKFITEWDNRDAAFQDVVQGIYSVIEERSHIQQEVNASMPERPWNIPRRNPFFTGREQLLSQLRLRLTNSKAAALSQTQAINGLGGIGKTQTAIEYAHRYRDEYRAAFWVSAASEKSLQNDFTKLASLLNLPEKDARDQNILQVVLRWFVQHQGWLLILDNADDPAILDDFLPFAGTPNGHILITTRAQALGALTGTTPISLEEMDRAEGTLLLLRRARLLASDAPLTDAPSEDRAQAEAIVDALDGLPLALDQAGAYIEEVGCGLIDYLALYQNCRKDLLNWLSELPSDYPHSVATAWDISLERITKINSAAVDLLRLCAFLDPDSIPEELFSEGASELSPLLQPVAVDLFKLNAAIEALRRYSLVRRNSVARTLTIHRLVQTVLIDEMNEETKHYWAECSVRTINKVFPFDAYDYGTWLLCQRLLPHAQVCANLIGQYFLAIPEAGHLLHRTAIYLQERALYEPAEMLYQQALQIYQKRLGLEHPYTATTLHELGRLYQAQGKYEQAEVFYQRTLHIYEKELGLEHLDIAGAQTYEELGPEHRDISATLTLNRLASLFQARGKYEQAEAFYQQSLQIYEKGLGPKHPNTARALVNLAVLYQSQGRYGQVEAFYQRALSVFENVLGYEHPATVTVVERYVSFLRQMGKDAEAADWLARIGKA